MREIKFRAWYKEEKRMLNWETHYEEIVDAIPYCCGDEYTEQFELMQYTGLKDKNCTEIYENDIVKCVSRNAYDMFGIIYIVLEDEQFSGFTPFTSYDFYSNRLNIPKYFEVIGNIYENPELLEN